MPVARISMISSIQTSKFAKTLAFLILVEDPELQKIGKTELKEHGWFVLYFAFYFWIYPFFSIHVD